MKKVEVPDSKCELNTFESLYFEEHREHPAVEEELRLQIDTFELLIEHWQDLGKKLVEEVHAPLDLAEVIVYEVVKVLHAFA